MNDKQWILALLQIIRADGNINTLFNEEYTFLKFTETMRVLKKQGYIRIEENRTILTSQGCTLYRELCKELGMRGLYRYLMPDLRNRVYPISFDDIYIPKKKRMKEKKNREDFSS